MHVFKKIWPLCQKSWQRLSTRSLLLIILGLLGVALIGMSVFRSVFLPKLIQGSFPPAQVGALPVAARDWQPTLYVTGSLSASKGVEISAETVGQVRQIFFKDGETVHAGTPLVQLDDSSEQAQLKSAQAQFQLASLTFQRTQKLFDQHATTRALLDDAQSRYTSGRGELENIQSLINKKLIRAPFAGKLGIKQISVGQFVNAGQSIVGLQAVKTLNVSFSLPQKLIKQISLNQKAVVSVDAYPGETFRAIVNAIESKVDEGTRTLSAQATVDNTEGKLYPGMFVDVTLLLPVEHEALVVPQVALTYTLYGTSVYRFVPDKPGSVQGQAKRVLVTIADKQGPDAWVTKGLQLGDIIIATGHNKLDDGAPVIIAQKNSGLLP